MCTPHARSHRTTRGRWRERCASLPSPRLRRTPSLCEVGSPGRAIRAEVVRRVCADRLRTTPRASRAPVCDRFSRLRTEELRALLSQPRLLSDGRDSPGWHPDRIRSDAYPPSMDAPRGLAPYPRFAGAAVQSLPLIRTFAVSLPADVSPPTVSAHSKVSDVFEISRVRTRRTVAPCQLGRIDFVRFILHLAAR